MPSIKVPDFVATVLPERIYKKELLTAAGLGAGGGALLSLLQNRKKNYTLKTRLKKALKRALYGGLIGAAADIGFQKIKEQLGGRFVGKRQALPDLTGKKNVEVYITGADQGPMKYWSARDKHKNTAFFAWDEKDDAVKYIKSLPKDINVTLVGHSYGGDSAYDIAQRVGDRVSRLQLLDPVGGRGLLSTFLGIPIFRPEKLKGTYAVEFAGNQFDNPTSAQKRSNLWALLGGRYDIDKTLQTDEKVVYPNDSHKLESTKWRRS